MTETTEKTYKQRIAEEREDSLKAFLWVAGIVFLIFWEFSPLSAFNDSVTTLYYKSATCVELPDEDGWALLSEECSKPEFGSLSFRVNPENQTVMALYGNDGAIPEPLWNCNVFDVDSWMCGSYVNGTIGKSHGDWVLPAGVESYYWKFWWFAKAKGNTN